VPPAPLTRHPQGLAGFFMPEIIFDTFIALINKIGLVSIPFQEKHFSPPPNHTGLPA
jgi:hypothetical protein